MVKVDDNNKEDKKKIVLTVEEFAGLGYGVLSNLGVKTELLYDPSFSGTSAIEDEFHNVTQAFIVRHIGFTDKNGNGKEELSEKNYEFPIK